MCKAEALPFEPLNQPQAGFLPIRSSAEMFQKSYRTVSIPCGVSGFPGSSLLIEYQSRTHPALKSWPQKLHFQQLNTSPKFCSH
jgi:hypothetical protein